MKSLLERSLQLYLFPGNPGPGFEHREMYDRAYRFWQERWTKGLRAIGGADPIADNFFRHNCLVVIARGEQIVAVHAYTIFDIGLAAHREHSYFVHHSTPKVLAQLDERNARRVMTMEYLCVSPEWRTSVVGVEMAAVISEIGMHFAKYQDVDAILGLAREAKGIDDLAKLFGARVLDEHWKLYNEVFTIIGFFRGDPKPFPRDEERNLAAALWQNRLDLTGPPPAKVLPFRRKEAV